MRSRFLDSEYLQNLAAECLCRLAPRRFAYWVGESVADMSYRRDEHGRLAVQGNIRRVCGHQGEEVSDDEVYRMARNTFRQFGKHCVDFFRLIRLPRERFAGLVSGDGFKHIDAAMARGKGVIILSAHLGNWELGGALLSSLGLPVNAVFMPKSNPNVDKLFRDCREKRGMKVTPLGSAARDTLAALKKNELVCLLADRDYTARVAVMEFFGVPARFPVGPARLCLHAGSPIVMGFTIRKKDDTFSCAVEEPIYPEDGMTVDDVQRRICGMLQGAIGTNPCQWFMFEDFWKDGGFHGKESL
jgi:KDO2-lipid IV(A) lauroyltransferase